MQPNVDFREVERNFIKMNDPCRKSEVAIRVAEFMELAKQPVKDAPCMPEKKIRKLSAELILEECVETIESLGCRVIVGDSGKLEIFQLNSDNAFDMEGAVDGCLDTIYVCHWALNAMGVSDALPMLEVCDANDRKFAEGHWIDDSGKLRKPPGWVGPDISGAIEAQSHWKGI